VRKRQQLNFLGNHAEAAKIMQETAVASKVLFTTDRTLMSDYHQNMFLGFGICAPPNVIPNWLYSWLFFPQSARKLKEHG